MSHAANQPFDESQLLALIEDQLDASAAARFRAELTDKPALLAQIDAMRADRQGLRSLPEPALPRDLLEALEPALARPMLLAPLSAAEYRKRHSRTRRPRTASLALAAAVLLALFAGVWAASTGMLTGDRNATPDPSDIHASRTPGEGVLAQRSRIATDSAFSDSMLASAADVAVHERVTVHHLPPPIDVRIALADASSKAVGPNHIATAASDLRAAAAIEPVTAPFVLVIETDNLERAIELLSRPLDPAKATISLVRNVTEEEVLEFGHMLALRSNIARQAEPPAVASTRTTTADRSQPVANAPARAGDFELSPEVPELVLGEQVAGDPGRAASVEEQLRFSNAGVQYALTVPADRLAEALMAVNLAAGQTTSLRSLDALDAPPIEKLPRTMPVELQWIEQLRSIRQSLANVDLAEARDVVIPVRIEVRESRKRR
jgi:hypothetical protein